ncbi:MAG TPA: CHAP domain-containing protein [Kofleriaceae bacterium]|nr:CHAP domain-containing protein [Kofleriaceae bacterium]
MTKQLDLIARIATHLPRLLISSLLVPFQAAPARAHDHLEDHAGQHRDERRAEPRPAPGAAHAVVTGDDYPAAWKRPGRDAFANISGFNRECVSFASWKVYVDSGGRQVPTGVSVPADWLTFSINVDADWGNASAWSAFATAHGVRMDNNPTPGSIAQWDKHPAIGMLVGHVGVVKVVHGDGSIEIEQYNLRENGLYSVLHMARNSSAVDRSNGKGPWVVPWPDHFIHIHGR